MDELSVKSYEKTQYIVVQLGVEQYGIDIQYVDNIVRMQSITRVPKVPEYINGVINLRGEVIPVMSIRLKMGYEKDEFQKSTRIIILKLEQHGTIGIIVDEVKEVVNLGSDEIEKFSFDNKDEKSAWLSGVGKYNEQLISLLDLNAVLQEQQTS